MNIKAQLTSMKKIILFHFVLLTGCMALPKQPPLTSNEEQYFKKLNSQCNCDIKREINPNIKKDSDEIEKGWYLLEFDKISCDKLLNKDSLNKVAFHTAKKIHAEILDSNFEYGYNKITIIFNCYKSESTTTSQSFNYSIKELANEAPPEKGNFY